ncbi:MAG: DNA polymerase [Candidatus Pacebacteria bacterium]|nr:DNA polymerase [Candidatus Paceibacterota bacterium]
MGKDNRKILVLLDAHAILHRAFHALPDFTSPKGEPTGALYGFTAFLLKVIRELKPDYIAAAYDMPQPTFRHAAYEDYKAKRPKMDDALAKQINRSRDILKEFNVPVYAAPGFEADDVLGTVVEKVKDKSGEIQTVIASGDMDTLQLVKNGDVVVYTLKKGINDTVIYDEKMVNERYGFGPEMIPDFKALKGDPSDNIIGVKGIGDKTATELIKKYGGIENLYGELAKGKVEAKPRVVELLKNSEEEARFSKTLAEIRRDAPIEFSLDDVSWKKNFDPEKIKNIFNELGFRSLINRLPGKNGEAVNAPEKEKIAVKEKETNEKENAAQKTSSGKTEVPEKLQKEIEKPLEKILTEMEKAGVLLDVDYLKKLSEEKHKELDELQKKIWNLAGEEFNINSPKQLGEILFVKLGLGGARPKKTATGAYSTNVSQLMKLKGSHEIIDHLMEFREISKLLSTYIDALPKLADKDNRLHTHFDSFGTVTGRLSSENPNLQNIPKRSERGREVRRAFIADKGFKLVDFDYSQIDLRVAAILSGDKNLVEIFKKGEDAHNSAAAKVFKVKPEDVTPEMRRKIKVINFGVLYGMGINALRQNLGGTREEAQKFYDEYFKSFSDLKGYIEKTKKFARENGWTETLFGRRRYFPEISSHQEYIKKEAERMAVNMPIQGTSADFIKLAMVRVDKILAEKGLKDYVRMLLQIHDELLFEVKENAVAQAAPIIIEAMEGVHANEVPLKVNAEVGDNWEEMKEYKV